MSYFINLENRTPHKLVDGVYLRTFWGEMMTAAIVDMEAEAVVPSHSHPAEQIGFVLNGSVSFTIGAETKVVSSGDMYIIPGDVTHSAIGGSEGAKLIEIFAPLREELKFDN